MGVLPLQFLAGQTWQSLGLTGEELFEIPVDEKLKARSKITVTARRISPSPLAGEGRGEGESVKSFECQVRIDTPVELDYYRNGGILQTVLRKLLA